MEKKTVVGKNHINKMAAHGSKGAAARKAKAEAEKKKTVPAAPEQQLAAKRGRGRPAKKTTTKNKRDPNLALQ